MDFEDFENSAAKDRLVTRLTQIGWIETSSLRDGHQSVRFTDLGLSCLGQLNWLIKQVGWPIGMEETQALQRICRQAERQTTTHCQMHQRRSWD